jgi:hypothetical protein
VLTSAARRSFLLRNVRDRDGAIAGTPGGMISLHNSAMTFVVLRPFSPRNRAEKPSIAIAPIGFFLRGIFTKPFPFHVSLCIL